MKKKQKDKETGQHSRKRRQERYQEIHLKKGRQEAEKHRDRGEIDGDGAEETNAETDQETSGEAPHMAAMTGKQTKIHSSPEISSKPLRGPPPFLLLLAILCLHPTADLPAVQTATTP